MKAKKFLNKTIDAIEDELEKRGMSNDYTIYWMVNNNIPIVSIMYPDETIQKYDIERFRRIHKEQDLSFKDVAAEITDMILNDIEEYNHSQNRDHISVKIANESDLYLYLTRYINQNVEKLMPFYTCIKPDTQFVLHDWKINGRIQPVLVPDFNTIDSMKEMIPIIPLGDAFEQYQIDFQENANQCSSFVIGQLLLPESRCVMPNPILNTSVEHMCVRFLGQDEQPGPFSKCELQDNDHSIYSQLTYHTSCGYIDMDQFLLRMMVPSLPQEKTSALINSLYELSQSNGKPYFTEYTPGAVGITSNRSENLYQAYSILHNDTVKEYIKEHSGTEVIVFPISTHECIVTEKDAELYYTLSQNMHLDKSSFADNPLLYNIDTGKLKYFDEAEFDLSQDKDVNEDEYEME